MSFLDEVFDVVKRLVPEVGGVVGRVVAALFEQGVVIALPR